MGNCQAFHLLSLKSHTDARSFKKYSSRLGFHLQSVPLSQQLPLYEKLQEKQINKNLSYYSTKSFSASLSSLQIFQRFQILDSLQILWRDFVKQTKIMSSSNSSNTISNESTNPRRCAACKYLRRRCSQDCILSPYFPPSNPRRFACVHRIFGASNVARMLQVL